jgi:hypothetical protein
MSIHPEGKSCWDRFERLFSTTLHTGAPSLEESDQWASHVSVLLKSEQEILSCCEIYVEERLTGGDIAGANKRKADTGGGGDEQKASDDAFALFD